MNHDTTLIIDHLYMELRWTIRRISKALKVSQVNVNKVLTGFGYDTRWKRGD